MEEKRAVARRERQVVGRLDSFCGLRQEGKKEKQWIQPRPRSGGIYDIKGWWFSGAWCITIWAEKTAFSVSGRQDHMQEARRKLKDV